MKYKLHIPERQTFDYQANESAKLQYQDELIEISTNEMLKASFKNGENLTEFRFQSTISRIYPGLWTVGGGRYKKVEKHWCKRTFEYKFDSPEWLARIPGPPGEKNVI
ncbi:Hypothetical protein CINCED_3A013738 [Cinara cedri]|uniref:Uncharacterized protein n=1 Tax=Cinara cedri TaxID=506608 RepID=A0A5E4N4I0_9HEMI|nr:Hypothetical protein CINCED_3A013738 [Cinara cedri]